MDGSWHRILVVGRNLLLGGKLLLPQLRSMLGPSRMPLRREYRSETANGGFNLACYGVSGRAASLSRLAHMYPCRHIRKSERKSCALSPDELLVAGRNEQQTMATDRCDLTKKSMCARSDVRLHARHPHPPSPLHIWRTLRLEG
eukprot:1165553-Pleurochrysis_carterae.AAC.4